MSFNITSIHSETSLDMPPRFHGIVVDLFLLAWDVRNISQDLVDPYTSKTEIYSIAR